MQITINQILFETIVSDFLDETVWVALGYRKSDMERKEALAAGYIGPTSTSL